MVIQRSWLTIVVPLVVALALGFLSGYLPTAILVVVLGGVAVAALLLHVEWAALLLVGTAVFEDYLVRVDPLLVKGLAVLLVGAWLIRRCGGPLHQRVRGGTFLAGLSFVVVLLLATVAHNNGPTGLAVLLRYAGFIAVLFVLADCLRAGLAPARLARVYVVACTVASVCGIVSYFLGEDRRVGGPIGDPNDFAFFLVPAVPLALALRRSGRLTWPYDLAAAIVLLGLVGTLSRGALVGVAAMTLFALLTRMVRVRAALAVVAVLGAILAVTAARFPDLVDTSLHQKQYVAGQNVSERLDLWSAAGRMTLEHPVLGMGPGSFSLHHREYMDQLPDDVNHPLDVAHNTYLEVSSELGVLGLLTFLALLVTAYTGAWSRWRRDGDPVAAAVCAGLVGTAVAATFVTEQYYLPLWLLGAFGAAFSLDRTRANV
ncbi:MAG: O-Antigen ligase [Nocardioides sp.]|nr:O-Antigen ligase [Nocardioides sp.]